MIPTYRAKKIDSDEWVDGYYFRDEALIPRYEHQIYITVEGTHKGIEVEIGTLAIHFPNMIDKNGKKIFASLCEDGVGGDIINLNENSNTYPLVFDPNNMIPYYEDFEDYTIVGIHKG